MSGYAALIAASFAFTGSHLLMSHPLRTPMVTRLGEKGFMGVYSLVSFATLGATVFAFRAAPVSPPHWAVTDTIWGIGTAIMWFASVLLIGSLVGNPALPDPAARVNATKPAQGVFAITRHPMMWSFILWGAVHIMVMPTTGNIILALAIMALAFFGALGQDAKKVRLMGTDWQGWQGRTGFFPFAMQLQGKSSLGDAIPSLGVLIIGTLLWLVASWGHSTVAAGIFRWVTI